MNRSISRLVQLSLVIPLGAGCSPASGAGPQAVAPVAEPETVFVQAPAVATDVEPGRFDTGKMWTFENAPLDYFEEAYGFRPTDAWLTKVRLASLRLPNCTASFVSPDGLVMSNHHCARGSTSAVTREGEDLLTNGFYAATRAEERRVPNLYVDQLVEMQDVTELIEVAVDPSAAEMEQAATRRARTAQVADSAGRELELRCDVTPLYQGGKYSLYCFKRYSDVRLVFVPELQIGYFGGDPDNFTYPRYVVDVSFFRVYDENGEPFKPEHYYGWSATGAKEGDAVFVIGNPGSTLRLNTMAQLEYRRDLQEPLTVRLLESRTAILERFMDHHPDQRPRYINTWFGLMNSLKLYRGRLKALKDPAIMGRKAAFERQFRDSVRNDPTLNEKYGSLWDDIAGLRRQMAELSPTLNALAQGGILRSQTLATAWQMLEYADSAASRTAPDSLVELMRRRIETAPINPMLDHHILQAQIEDAMYLLGEGDPFVQHALAGRSPEEAAQALTEEARALTDPAMRKALLDDPESIRTSDDPALRLMREAMARRNPLDRRYQELQKTERILVPKLARAMFEVYGTSVAPDATFTLRIADGVVKSYEYNGTLAPPHTTFYGMYDRYYSHGDRAEWQLPQRWLDPPSEFDMSTPLNMVSTNDITGGNSGSPVINTEAEIVGLIFDGNIESLSGDFIYTTETARAVSVRAEAIVEALEHIYGAQRIVDELLGNR